MNPKSQALFRLMEAFVSRQVLELLGMMLHGSLCAITELAQQMHARREFQAEKKSKVSVNLGYLFGFPIMRTVVFWDLGGSPHLCN